MNAFARTLSNNALYLMNTSRPTGQALINAHLHQESDQANGNRIFSRRARASEA